MSDRLSLLLRAHVDDLKREHWEGQSQDEKKQQLVGDTFVDAIIASLIETRENFNPVEVDPATLFANDCELLEDLLDERYTLRGLAEVAGYVGRTVKLSQLRGESTPSKQTNVYVREATRSYIYGFSMASAAMSRAALEQALKEQLGHQGDKVFVDFRDLVEEAQKWNILDKTGAAAAKDIAKKCNALLHEEPIGEDEAYQILVGVRSLLEEIYSADGRY